MTHNQKETLPFSINEAIKETKLNERQILRLANRGEIDLLFDLEIDFNKLTQQQKEELEKSKLYEGKYLSFCKYNVHAQQLNLTNIEDYTPLWDIGRVLKSSNGYNHLAVSIKLLIQNDDSDMPENNPLDNLCFTGKAVNSYIIIMNNDGNYGLKYITEDNRIIDADITHMYGLVKTMKKLNMTEILKQLQNNTEGTDLINLLDYQSILDSSQKTVISKIFSIIATYHPTSMTYRRRLTKGEDIASEIPLLFEKFEPISTQTITEIIKNDSTNKVLLKKNREVSYNPLSTFMYKKLKQRHFDGNTLTEKKLKDELIISSDNLFISEHDIEKLKKLAKMSNISEKISGKAEPNSGACTQDNELLRKTPDQTKDGIEYLLQKLKKLSPDLKRGKYSKTRKMALNEILSTLEDLIQGFDRNSINGISSDLHTFCLMFNPLCPLLIPYARSNFHKHYCKGLCSFSSRISQENFWHNIGEIFRPFLA